MGLNGVLVMDKPSGWTSMDVCAKLRGVFHEKRVGHGGTLDPMATGVLPVFVGRATRAADFVTEGEKTYAAELLLGVTTDTQDVTGTTLAAAPAPEDALERLAALLPRFTGEIDQIPPMYSALKIGGQKLYDMARKGKEVERKPRRITVRSLQIQGSLPGNRVRLEVVCSKGTYVRTLCHDLGEALGCGGTMAALRRTRVGQFGLEEAVTMEEFLAHPAPETLLRPVDSCFGQPKAVISGTALKRARNGNPFPLERPDGTYRVYDPEGSFLLLGRCRGRECRIIKSFYEVEDT